jgi:hypothetical protein
MRAYNGVKSKEFTVTSEALRDREIIKRKIRDGKN